MSIDIKEEIELETATEAEEVADRLIAERVRLGYSQADFARQIDVSRNTLRTYELGHSNIPSNILIRMGSIGVDVLYVLFNIKNEQIASNLAEKVRDEGKSRADVFINNSSLSHSVLAGKGATVNQIHTTHHTTKTIAEVKPGQEHITDQQASEIQKLVDDIVTIEANVKQKPRNHRAVWTALNRRMKVPSYRLIKLEQFDDALKYLRSSIGRLMASATARKKMPENEWRNRKYRFIHASFKEFPELEEWFKKHIAGKFKVQSKADLQDEELEKAYASLSNKKRELMKKRS
ncbi:MAG: ORF6C domain-containing protein [Alysiella sp.]|uniref:transcriptional regulator n=1 Tax=Alysiella sp. TaxID=1872483 RepID=UPI0026DDAD2D|nr:transcriptional regulator [Alysiella sp.]MDO4434004.1 ORF6C domain-containing protein [Alysiella sp.]